MPPKDLEVINVLGNCSSYSDLAVTITGEKKGKGYAPRRKYVWRRKRERGNMQYNRNNDTLSLFLHCILSGD